MMTCSAVSSLSSCPDFCSWTSSHSLEGASLSFRCHFALAIFASEETAVSGGYGSDVESFFEETLNFS